MRIEELFRRDIRRTIEEVVKVDDADEATIANELEEYVATEHILEEFETVLEAYQESILSPNESCTVWVSGFFGSGKSSWAKILGYLLANPPVGDESAAERFFGRTHAPPVQALLNTVHARSPTLTVLVNLATGANVVAAEGESVVLPIYRALLDRLGYSRNDTLAELEYTLEGDGKLAEFEEAFAAIDGRPWRERRYTALAKRLAARALDAVYGSSGGLPEWAQGLDAPDIDADWFAARALELLERRGGGCRRLAFVVDEAGQYVARSVHRMLDLQGLAEAFQKRRGRLWLVVTSQERLDDVVDSLEAKQVELARAQARFPLRVDLLPSDIDEVTGKRVLEKTAEGGQAVRAVIEPSRNKLVSNVRLASPIRSGEPGLDELVRLHPLLPYQIQLLIDAVSVRRTKGGASPTVGGSNRTLIKHAQQLVVHPEVGLGDCEVGTLGHDGPVLQPPRGVDPHVVAGRGPPRGRAVRHRQCRGAGHQGRRSVRRGPGPAVDGPRTSPSCCILTSRPRAGAPRSKPRWPASSPTTGCARATTATSSNRPRRRTGSRPGAASS